jgi:hypothetical protein
MTVDRIYLYLTMIFISASTCYGQNIQVLIDSVKRQTIFDRYEEYKSNITSIKFNSPFIDEVNLRTETDQNNLARQEFALRVIFNGVGISKIYKQQKEIYLQRNQIEREEKLQDQLFGLYSDLIDANFMMRRRRLFDDQKVFSENRLQHYIRIIGTGASVSAKDVLKVEEEIYKSTLERGQIDKKLSGLQAKYGTSFKNLLDLWSIDELLTKVEKIVIVKNQSFDYRKALLDQDDTKVDFRIRSRNDHRILDYAQIRYSKRDNLLFEDEFSLGLGLRLPYKGSLRREKDRVLLDNYDFIRSTEINHVDRLQEFNELKEKFMLLVGQIRFYNRTNDQVFKTLNSAHPDNAEEVFYFKEDLRIGSSFKVLEIEQELWHKYLEILKVAEQLDADDNILVSR